MGVILILGLILFVLWVIAVWYRVNESFKDEFMDIFEDEEEEAHGNGEDGEAENDDEQADDVGVEMGDVV